MAPKGTAGMTREQRFWAKVHKGDVCWNWTGSLSAKGYGQLSFRRCTRQAHRYAYEMLVGAVPRDLVVDHLCRNKRCVNPDHLELVTSAENVRRGKSATKLHCKAGHLLTGTQPTGGRYCLECKRLKRRKPCRRCGGLKGAGETRHLCDGCEQETGQARWMREQE